MSLHKKIKRTIWEHKSQYIGAIILIMLSSMLFAVFNIMGANVLHNLEYFKTENVQEDAYFIVAEEIGNLSALEDTYDALIEKRRALDVDYSDNATLRILSATKKVNLFEVVDGKDIANINEILVDPEFAKAHDITIGSDIQLFDESFEVTGFVCTPDYIYPLKNTGDLVKNAEAFGIAVISSESFENLNQGYTFYSIKFDKTNEDALKNELKETNTIISWVDKEDNMRISFIEGDVKGIGPMGTVLPLAILIVTCLMVAVILWRLLRKEFTQIGVFYAIGYKKREILFHYITYPLLMASIGGFLGTLFGALMVNPFVTYVSTFYNLPVLSIDYKPGIFIFSILLPFLVLLPLALMIILKALRMSPLQLMKGGINKSKINFLERTIHLQHFNFRTKFKIREIIRNIPRTILLFFGVVCASTLLLLGFGTKDSMDFLLNNSFKDTYSYDYIYTFNALQTEEPAYGEKVSLSAFTVLSNEFAEETTIIYGIEEDAKLINLSDAEGKKIDYNQVIVTKSLADRYDLLPGSIITVQNNITMDKLTLTVDAIAMYYMGDLIYLPLTEFNEIMDFPQGSYLTLYSDKKISVDDSNLISVTNRQDIETGYDSMIKPIRAMSGIIGIISFVIGLIILYVVTSLLIEENKENISLLKVLGYEKKQLYILMLNPYTIFVVIGYVLAIPLILISLSQFFQIMTAEMNMSIPARINAASIIGGFIIIFLTYQITKKLNSRKIKKISMSESLKSSQE